MPLKCYAHCRGVNVDEYNVYEFREQVSMELWSAPTPNGWKISIMLEELAEAGIELDVSVRTINLSAGEQFAEDFIARNPNSKIPVLKDGDLCIPESCAILHYLAEKYPTALLPAENQRRWDILSWVYWQAANLGPVFGNKLSYTRYMPDVDPVQKEHPLKRFGTEALRLVAVLDTKLGDQPYVCGDFSIADIAIYPWIRGYKWSKVDITTRPRVEAWMHRVRARPGVARGIAYGVPEDEKDTWSAERKAQYAQGGASIASDNVASGEPPE
ncbi:MAG: glutathione S-transferase N-terminal domain-containing protein [Pseudomonadales bacterium]